MEVICTVMTLTGFIVGVVCGMWAFNAELKRKQIYGYFKVVPVDEEAGMYSVNVAITPNQEIISAEYLTLKKDTSR